jgi:hypothetical protein
MEWLAVIIGTVAVLAAVFLRGKAAGESKTELEQAKEVLDNVRKAKEADTAANADDARQRLRYNLRK